MKKLKLVNMKTDFLNRNVNEGFSGGERKRNEILQLAVLGADLAILDEIDSGLDVDALKDVASAVNQILTPQNSLMMITHYRRILDLLKPTHVHVMVTYDLLFIFIVIASFGVVIRLMYGFSLFVIGIVMLVHHIIFPFYWDTVIFSNPRIADKTENTLQYRAYWGNDCFEIIYTVYINILDQVLTSTKVSRHVRY